MKFLLLMLTTTAFIWSNIGNVGAFKGTASIIRDSQTLNITSGMLLKVKDKVITEEYTRVQVILKDDTVVTIGPKSTFVFDAYTFGTKDDSEVKMHLDRGFFRSVTGKIGKLAPERFKVKTVSATIGIRGTDFSALVSDNQEVVSCYKGSINVVFKNEDFLIPAGSALELLNGKAKVKLFSEENGLQTTDNVADDVASITQQAEINKLTQVPMDQPTVEFPNR